MTTLKTILTIFAVTVSMQVSAQVENVGEVRRHTEKDAKEKVTGPVVSERMKESLHTKKAHDADMKYMREVYRRLDLTKGTNAALYYPEDIIDGNENLFRIMMRLVTEGSVPAYEYLDGREIFTDQYRVNVADMLERFGIYAQKAKGSIDRNPKFVIEEADVPTTQVLDYYIIEKWEFDNRSNRMKTFVEAICPVLNRSGDFGGDARYPMFWIKFEDIRPYLISQNVFLSDDNNIPRYSLDDFFNLGLYEGEIYKTRNLRNLSLAQMFPDEDDRKRAADSIDHRLRTYGKDLWVPSREEYLATKEKKQTEAKTESDSIPERTIVTSSDDLPATSSRAKKKSSKSKTVKKSSGKNADISSKSGSSSRSAARSVRRRKR